WLHVLRFAEHYVAGEPVPDDLREEEELAMAIEEARRVPETLAPGSRRQGVNADDRLRALLEDRDKAERARLTDLAVARLEGREEGREEGHREERQDLARKMLAEGFPPTTVAKITGLSAEDLAALAPPKNP
ncbi:MAG: hypothetical protein GX442_24695, partial [Candidatus Riflebacteria bacterium]|nr:hypothetical protein [Candidatus Riflebacteria bacterium]